MVIHKYNYLPVLVLLKFRCRSSSGVAQVQVSLKFRCRSSSGDLIVVEDERLPSFVR